MLRSSEEKNNLSWEETYRAMAAEREDWSDFDVTITDGLQITITGNTGCAPEVAARREPCSTSKDERRPLRSIGDPRP